MKAIDNEMIHSMLEELKVNALSEAREHCNYLKFGDVPISKEQFDSFSAGEKADVIRYALEISGIKDKTQAIMIGDRKYDILGAKENGIDSIGVLYGYGDRAEHVAAGAGMIVESVEQLLQLLI